MTFFPLSTAAKMPYWANNKISLLLHLRLIISCSSREYRAVSIYFRAREAWITTDIEVMKRLLPPAGARVLELGCGRALMTRQMVERLGAALVIAEDRILSVTHTEHRIDRGLYARIRNAFMTHPSPERTLLQSDPSGPAAPAVAAPQREANSRTR
jgi:hypothetical protein